MSIIFAIPTIFMNHRQDVIKRCINALIDQCELSQIPFTIFLILNSDRNVDFENWKINSNNVRKLYSNTKFNISISLNKVIDEIQDDTYFCFIHDDQIILDDDWIKNFIKIYESKSLNCGVLGLREHYQGKTLIKKVKKKYQKGLKYQLEEHTWVNGCMFMSIESMKKVGKFDENYFGDCESEDYNYLLRELGHKNYRVIVENKHFSTSFEGKTNEKDNSEFQKHVNLSRKYRKQKWGNKSQITKNLF